MAWIALAIAIAAEIVATTSLKYSDGFSKLGPSMVTVVGYVIAFTALGQSLKTLEVGVAYAIWAGLGTAVVAVIGITLLGEATSPTKLLGIAMVVGGVVLLNLGGGH